jgi:hypothetical protein
LIQLCDFAHESTQGFVKHDCSHRRRRTAHEVICCQPQFFSFVAAPTRLYIGSIPQ